MLQISGIPSVAPGADLTVYIVLDDFGKPGAFFRETDTADCDRASVVNRWRNRVEVDLIRRRGPGRLPPRSTVA